MLNLAGSSYDYGNVLFAVLQECEHNRRALLPNEAAGRLQGIARAKLAEIRESYEECGGTATYWEQLEREVLETALPQYIPAVIEQNRLEKSNYDLWRQGEPWVRIAFGLLGLLIGILVVLIPQIPITDKAITLVLAALGFLYPEIKKAVFDYRHTRLLNRLITHAEKYQKDQRLHYVSEARLTKELDAVGKPPAVVRKKKTATEPADPKPPRQRDRAS
jgi:hypothetical protein